MGKITRETETVWIWIKHDQTIEGILEKSGIHYKKVAVIELEEIDEPETLEELELFKKRDGEESIKVLSFSGKVQKL